MQMYMYTYKLMCTYMYILGFAWCINFGCIIARIENSCINMHDVTCTCPTVRLDGCIRSQIVYNEMSRLDMDS